jgi:tetratricopeptide (TPR) repeat protein
MKTCPKCGSQSKSGNFCRKCGTALPDDSPEISARIYKLTKQIEETPLDARPHGELGHLYLDSGRMKEALLEFEKASALDEQDYDSRLQSGLIYLASGNVASAEQSLRRALRIRPDLLEAKIGLFKVCHSEGKHDEAVAIGEDVVRLDPGNVEVHRGLKAIYSEMKNTERALAELEILSSLVPEDIETLAQLASLYEERGSNDRAYDCHQRIAQLAPHDPKVRARSLLFIGRYHCIKGNNQVCIQHLEKHLADLTSELESPGHLCLALAYSRSGDPERALEHIESAGAAYGLPISTEDKKELAEAYYQVARFLTQKNDLSRAVGLLETAARLDAGAIEYADALRTAQSELKARENETSRRRRQRVIVVVAGIAVAFAVWTLSHGKIRVEVTPQEHVAMYVDGKATEPARADGSGALVSPLKFFGSHSVRLVKDGYEEWTGAASVGFGRTTTIRATLVPIYGFLEVTSIPAGAAVLLDGEELGKTPLETAQVLATHHDLIVVDGFHRPYSVAVSIQRDEMASVGPVRLVDLTGTWKGELTVYEHSKSRNQPDRAEVWVGPVTMWIRITQNQGTIDLSYTISQTSIVGEEGRVSAILEEGAIKPGQLVSRRVYYGSGTRPETFEGFVSSDWNRLDGTVLFASNRDLRGKWWVARRSTSGEEGNGALGGGGPDVAVGTIVLSEPEGNNYLLLTIRDAQGGAVSVWCSGERTKVYSQTRETTWAELVDGRRVRVSGEWKTREGEQLLWASRIDLVQASADASATARPASRSVPRFFVRAYNADDKASISVNGREAVTVGYKEDSGKVCIDAFLRTGDNNIVFAVDDLGGSFAYGFQLFDGGKVIWADLCGSAGLRGCDKPPRADHAFEKVYSLSL